LEGAATHCRLGPAFAILDDTDSERKAQERLVCGCVVSLLWALIRGWESHPEQTTQKLLRDGVIYYTPSPASCLVKIVKLSFLS